MEIDAALERVVFNVQSSSPAGILMGRQKFSREEKKLHVGQKLSLVSHHMLNATPI